MDFSAANTSLWNIMLQMGLLSGILLVANILRRKIPFVEKTLLPTAVIAGFIALFLRAFDWFPVKLELLEIITYHSIAIGFIALSLQVPEKRSEAESGGLVAAKSGALIVATYLIQGFFGLLITISLAYTLMPNLFKASGILLPMGFGQGPGQANNVGSTYENLGFVGGQSFGLSIAAAGYLVACVVGVIYLNYLKRKGAFKNLSSRNYSESLDVAYFQSEKEIPVSESIDRFSIQIALILFIYFLTYLASLGLTNFLTASAPGLAKSLSPLIWGFNFIIGSFLATLFRGLFKLLQKAKLMTRQYPNNYLLARVSGLAFDYMVIAGIASIEIKDVQDLWLPLVLLCVVGTVVTIFFLQWLCKKIYPGYYYEGLLSMYGMLTGTISSGILLLREIDPHFRTPAAINLVTGSSFAIFFGAPMLLFIGLAPESDTMLFLTVGMIFVYLLALVAFILKAGKKTRKA